MMDKEQQTGEPTPDQGPMQASELSTEAEKLASQLAEKEQRLELYAQQLQQQHDKLHNGLAKMGIPIEAEEQEANAELCFPEEHVTQLFEAVEKNQQLQTKLQERMLRLQADFDNFRKRTRQEKAEWADSVTADVLKEFLPVVDNFERALSAAQQKNSDSEFVSGVEMIFHQFQAVLENLGVQAIVALHEPFDPNLHEAVMREVDESMETDTVIQQLQTGYLYKHKTLRPSMVKVASKS